MLIESTPEQYWAPGHTSRTDLAKLRAGSVDAIAVAIAVGPGPRTSEGLAEARNDDFADSSRPQNGEGEEHHGLSPLGREAVTHLNALGAVVDVSQLTPAGVRQVLELTKAPVIATHSDARALVDNTRNLSDEEAPNVTRELLRRGYPEAQIAKIWGGNFLRVFREVEAVARRLKATGRKSTGRSKGESTRASCKLHESNLRDNREDAKWRAQSSGSQE